MNTLDKISIAVPLNERVVNIANRNHFLKRTPYFLDIKIVNNKGVAYITFTGKILLDNYPNLINRDTIRMALEEINNNDGVHINIDRVLEVGKVTSCDVTKDIDLNNFDIMGLNQLKKIAKISINNNGRWIYENYRRNGLVVKNAVGTGMYKRRIIFYDKQQELLLSDERGFLNALNDRERVINYFNGKTRIEANLYASRSIRDSFNIDDNSISSVLNAETNALANIMGQMFQRIYRTERHITPSILKNIHVLKQFNDDLQRIRAHYLESARNNISGVMKPFKKAYQLKHDETNRDFNICSLVE